MDKINFQNLPNQTTPINATNLNQLQTNVENGILDYSVVVYIDGYIDPNTTLYPFILTRNANAPSAALYYIETIFYNGRSTTSNRKQIAYGYTTNAQYERYYYNGTWSSWEKIVRMESGTWTPALDTAEGAAPTYTTITGGAKGTYKKMDNMVFISFFLRGSITALNGTNNYALIKGLPFTPRIMNMGENTITVGTCYNCLTSDNPVWFDIYDNAIRIQGSRGSSSTVWKVTPSGGYFIIAGSGWYEVA